VALLRAVVKLIKDAQTNPGGNNFDLAKNNLNQFFKSESLSAFALGDAERAYLTDRLGGAAQRAIADLESNRFEVRDARHIEDCLLMSTVARRVAGDGDDLTRVRRVFDWLMLQVQLVPAGALAVPGGMQAQARPYDVLIRAMATEEGGWAERSWLFMSLCRQLGLDSGLILYSSRQPSLLEAKPAEPKPPGSNASGLTAWIVAVLIDGKPYLFDCRMGRVIPGPAGQGIATLEQVLTDPTILDQLDLPGKPYSTHTADLARGPLTVWLDSTLGFLTGRMRMLQEEFDSTLPGRERMVLFRDPAAQQDAFATAMGPRLARTELWYLPMEVEYQLFNNSAFVEATKYAIGIFDHHLPLLPARMGQLRGDLKGAVESYGAFRFAEKPVENDGQTPISPMTQKVLDMYATHYLGLAKIDQREPKLARLFFEQSLRRLPPADDLKTPFYFAFYRWGAHTGLGWACQALGDRAAAIRHLSSFQPTPQYHGNLIEARELIWSDPFVPEAAPSP
jgi:hypothetical protein